MKHKLPIIVIMWILYGTFEEYLPILSNDFVSWIPIILTICLLFDFYPKIFSRIYQLEKKVIRKIKDKTPYFLNENTKLVLNGNKVEDILVYYNNEKICNLKEFEKDYPNKYEDFLKKIIASLPIHNETINKPHDQVKSIFQENIEAIDSYNIDIPDEDISLGLYNCTNQLKYLQKLLLEYPQENDKINKLEQYYLPILLDILENYCKVSKTNESATKSKLNQTLVLVNEAIKNITQSLFDEDQLNLNVDMDVLNNLLKKDGLVIDKMNKEDIQTYMEKKHE